MGTPESREADHGASRHWIDDISDHTRLKVLQEKRDMLLTAACRDPLNPYYALYCDIIRQGIAANPSSLPHHLCAGSTPQADMLRAPIVDMGEVEWLIRIIEVVLEKMQTGKSES